MQNKVNFFITASYVKQNNLNHHKILEQAYKKNMINDKDDKLLSNFIEHIKNIDEIKSQLYQDVFASFVIGNKYEKSFLEFGATNGIDLSNTYILEKNMNWSGYLSEPSPQWHEELKKNRPNNKIITECIWSKSNENLDFFVSDVGVLSTINDFKESDKISMPGNTTERTRNGKIISIKSTSLNDVIAKSFNSKSPSYMSIDTEGSEYEILKYFDFKKYRPIVFTIEHNFTEYQAKINKLMLSNGYVRVLASLTAFDSWYITKEAYNLLNK